MGVLDWLFGQKEPKGCITLIADDGERICVPSRVARAMLMLNRRGRRASYRLAGSGKPKFWRAPDARGLLPDRQKSRR